MSTALLPRSCRRRPRLARLPRRDQRAALPGRQHVEHLHMASSQPWAWQHCGTQMHLQARMRNTWTPHSAKNRVQTWLPSFPTG